MRVWYSASQQVTHADRIGFLQESNLSRLIGVEGDSEGDREKKREQAQRSAYHSANRSFHFRPSARLSVFGPPIADLCRCERKQQRPDKEANHWDVTEERIHSHSRSNLCLTLEFYSPSENESMNRVSGLGRK